MAVWIRPDLPVQFWASRYIMCLNRTFKWNIMTIWISWELWFFNYERLGISWALIVHACQKLWPYELDQSLRVQFRVSPYIMCLNRTSEWKVLTFWISRELPFFNYEWLDISGPESYTYVKSYGHMNCTRVSVFSFEHLNILYAWIGYLS